MEGGTIADQRLLQANKLIKWWRLPFHPPLPSVSLVPYPNKKHTRKRILGNIVQTSQVDTL